MRNPSDETTRSTGSSSAGASGTSSTSTERRARPGTTSAAPIARETTRNVDDASESAASSTRARSDEGARTVNRSARKTANASADNVLPEGDAPYTLDDPIYGQPAGPVLARSDRVVRNEILKRRLSPAAYEEVMQRQQEEADAAERARASEQQ